MKSYTVMSLSYISRLALLENADRTRSAIDDLVTVLRYMEDAGEVISTLSAELEILRKMFALNREKKGQSFRYIFNCDTINDRCYLPKGLLVTVAELAMDKPIARERELLEVIVSVTVTEHQVTVMIKDNGSTDCAEAGMCLEDLYRKRLRSYDQNRQQISVEIKPGIGTAVEMIFSE